MRRTDVLPIVWGVLVSILLLGIRYAVEPTITFFYLPYNLGLAFVPLSFAWLIVHYNKHHVLSPLGLVFLGGMWLIFFPNAPYIITDFVHLVPRFGIPVWFDALLILSFAASGLLAGWYSLYLMQVLVVRRFDKMIGWVFVVVSLALASFGVYLGRFLRWNSWDLFLDPLGLATDVLSRLTSPLLHLRLWLIVGLLLGFFLISYSSLVVFLSHQRGSRGSH